MKTADYGLLAEFATPDALLHAVQVMRQAGYRDLEAYTPFAVDGLADALQLPQPPVALWTLVGGLSGGIGGLVMQWYSAVVDYPLNSGGRPLASWPAFLPAVFELTILGAALAAFASLLFLTGLPQLRHPLFEVQDFHLASRDRFFLCVRASDPQFSAAETRRRLEATDARQLFSVPNLVDSPTHES